MSARAMGHTATGWQADGTRTVELDIRHLDSDSYSRAVDPAAMRWARATGCRTYPGSWSLVDVRYSTREAPPAPRGNGRPECVSIAVFRVTR